MEKREIVLPQSYIEIIRKIFLPYTSKIKKIILFGSRATGKAKPYSDIDIAIVGELSAEELTEIRELFEESSLPIEVDVILYSEISSNLLKNHIEKFGVEIKV